MIPNQKIVDSWKGIYLSDFAERALEILQGEPNYDEVVLPADNIIELLADHLTPPQLVHSLPVGYEYHFSGYYGHVLGIRRVGQWEEY